MSTAAQAFDNDQELLDDFTRRLRRLEASQRHRRLLAWLLVSAAFAVLALALAGMIDARLALPPWVRWMTLGVALLAPMWAWWRRRRHEPAPADALEAARRLEVLDPALRGSALLCVERALDAGSPSPPQLSFRLAEERLFAPGRGLRRSRLITAGIFAAALALFAGAGAILALTSRGSVAGATSTLRRIACLDFVARYDDRGMESEARRVLAQDRRGGFRSAIVASLTVPEAVPERARLVGDIGPHAREFALSCEPQRDDRRRFRALLPADTTRFRWELGPLATSWKTPPSNRRRSIETVRILAFAAAPSAAAAPLADVTLGAENDGTRLPWPCRLVVRCSWPTGESPVNAALWTGRGENVPGTPEQNGFRFDLAPFGDAARLLRADQAPDPFWVQVAVFPKAPEAPRIPDRGETTLAPDVALSPVFWLHAKPPAPPLASFFFNGSPAPELLSLLPGQSGRLLVVTDHLPPGHRGVLRLRSLGDARKTPLSERDLALLDSGDAWEVTLGPGTEYGVPGELFDLVLTIEAENGEVLTERLPLLLVATPEGGAAESLATSGEGSERTASEPVEKPETTADRQPPHARPQASPTALPGEAAAGRNAGDTDQPNATAGTKSRDSAEQGFEGQETRAASAKRDPEPAGKPSTGDASENGSPDERDRAQTQGAGIGERGAEVGGRGAGDGGSADEQDRSRGDAANTPATGPDHETGRGESLVSRRNARVETGDAGGGDGGSADAGGGDAGSADAASGDASAGREGADGGFGQSATLSQDGDPAASATQGDDGRPSAAAHEGSAAPGDAVPGAGSTGDSGATSAPGASSDGAREHRGAASGAGPPSGLDAHGLERVPEAAPATSLPDEAPRRVDDEAASTGRGVEESDYELLGLDRQDLENAKKTAAGSQRPHDAAHEAHGAPPSSAKAAPSRREEAELGASSSPGTESPRAAVQQPDSRLAFPGAPMTRDPARPMPEAYRRFIEAYLDALQRVRDASAR